MRVQDPSTMHCFNPSGQTANQISAAASWLTNEGEALFAIATTAGSVVVVKMPPYGIQSKREHSSSCLWITGGLVITPSLMLTDCA